MNWIELGAWAVVSFVGAVAVTQLFRWHGGLSVVAIVQALTPYLGVSLVPVLILASWHHRYALAAVSAAVGLGLLVLAAPLVAPRGRTRPLGDAAGLRVASANLWYQNSRVTDVSDALADIDPDVIVFNEYTSEHRDVLLTTSLAMRYPHKVDVSHGGALGTALWSRRPIAVDSTPATYGPSVDVTVDGPDGEVRIVASHFPTPIDSFDGWRRDHGVAQSIGRSVTGPTLLIGDLNTSYWHPDFRRLLGAGFVDAHIVNGAGFAMSWPTTWIVPPFVQLDHALTTGDLVSTEVDNFEVPGSDHRGIVVTVSPTR